MSTTNAVVHRQNVTSLRKKVRVIIAPNGDCCHLFSVAVLEAENRAHMNTIEKISAGPSTVRAHTTSSQLRKTTSVPRSMNDVTAGLRATNPYCDTCRQLRDRLIHLTGNDQFAYEAPARGERTMDVSMKSSPDSGIADAAERVCSTCYARSAKCDELTQKGVYTMKLLRSTVHLQ
jgi:hypothetical protein